MLTSKRGGLYRLRNRADKQASPASDNSGMAIVQKVAIKEPRVWNAHYLDEVASLGLCQSPSAAISAFASFGPQVPRLYGRTR
jgi:hypothetical protein